MGVPQSGPLWRRRGAVAEFSPVVKYRSTVHVRRGLRQITLVSAKVNDGRMSILSLPVLLFWRMRVR